MALTDQMMAVSRPTVLGSNKLTGLQGALINRSMNSGHLPHAPSPHLPERTSMHLGTAEDTPKIQTFMKGMRGYGSR